jgi:hypothetical protein
VLLELTLPGATLVVSHHPGGLGVPDHARTAVHETFHAMQRKLEDHVRRRHQRTPQGRWP